MKIKSKDIDECAFLWVNGFNLTDTEIEMRYNREVVYFILENVSMENSTYMKLQESFDNCLTRVEPKEFSRRQQDLKNIVYKKIKRNK